MRPLASFLLTALILINLFGFYAIFVFKQADVKNEMAAKISSSLSTAQSETLTFDKSEFSKLPFNDCGKEFRYNGRLYDVVNIEKTGNQVKITVEYDARETDLIETFGSLFSQQQDKDQGTSPVKSIITHFQQDYVISHKYVLPINNMHLVAYCAVNQSYPPSSFVADKLAPPPQSFLV